MLEKQSSYLASLKRLLVIVWQVLESMLSMVAIAFFEVAIVLYLSRIRPVCLSFRLALTKPEKGWKRFTNQKALNGVRTTIAKRRMLRVSYAYVRSTIWTLIPFIEFRGLSPKGKRSVLIHKSGARVAREWLIDHLIYKKRAYIRKKLYLLISLRSNDYF